MGAYQQLDELINDYISEFKGVLEKSSPTAGLFGLYGDPANHPCHMTFYEKAGRITEELLSSEPDEEELFAVTELLLKAHHDRECHRAVRLMLTAVQKYAVPLIGGLSDAHKSKLKEWYDNFVPRQVRLPVERDVYHALKKK